MARQGWRDARRMGAGLLLVLSGGLPAAAQGNATPPPGGVAIRNQGGTIGTIVNTGTISGNPTAILSTGQGGIGGITNNGTIKGAVRLENGQTPPASSGAPH
jgi:hypothetical protein